MLDLGRLTASAARLDVFDSPYSAELVIAARDEIARLRRIVGLLADYVETEAHDAGSPDPEELLIACGLATWETYDRSIHGDDLGCYVEPGERVWITTDECKRLIEEANNAR